MKVNIRKANFNDLESIYNFICLLENQQFDRFLFEKLFRDNLTVPVISYFVAEVPHQKFPTKKTMVGFISLYILPQLHHCSKVAEIMELFVDEKFRSRNIGSALIDRAMKIAKKNKCVLLEVATNRKRTRAHHFYEKEKFRKTHFKFTIPL